MQLIFSLVLFIAILQTNVVEACQRNGYESGYCVKSADYKQ